MRAALPRIAMRRRGRRKFGLSSTILVHPPLEVEGKRRRKQRGSHAALSETPGPKTFRGIRRSSPGYRGEKKHTHTRWENTGGRRRITRVQRGIPRRFVKTGGSCERDEILKPKKRMHGKRELLSLFSIQGPVECFCLLYMRN